MIAAALGLLVASTTPAPPPPPVSVHAEIYAQTTIIRVPAHRSSRYRPPHAKEAPPPPPRFKEKKGPRCIEAASIGAAAITTPETVDFILKGGKRVRAKLDHACTALDYYSSFYVRPPADGKICADRDDIHARSGGNCEIDKFRLLTPLP